MKSKYLLVLLICHFSLSAIKAQDWNGTGVVLSSAGYVATSNHELEPGFHFEVDVFINDIKKTYVGTVVKSDPNNDLTIIKIDDPSFLSIGTVPYTYKIKDVKDDEKIFIMGYPSDAKEKIKVQEGTISSKSGYPNDVTMYQISCIPKQGCAGAPLFDNAGNLIGIINSTTTYGQSAGYAVKISCLHNLLETLPKMPPMPSKTTISALSLSDKTEVLSKFVVSVKTSNKVVTDMSKNKKMYVGQTYGGGIIFYVDETGEHGLIASFDTGESERAQWGCYNLLIDDTETGINSGLENTKKIITGCRSGSERIAARLCNQYVASGYSDWYLPSKEELNVLYEQKELIGGYEHGYYWSSSEVDSHFAWYQHFDFGFQDYLNKDFSYFFRPIRSF